MGDGMGERVVEGKRKILSLIRFLRSVAKARDDPEILKLLSVIEDEKVPVHIR